MKWSVLCVAAAAMLAGAPVLRAQSTPEELAQALISAVRTQDADAARKLVHTSAPAFAGADRIQSTIRGLLTRTALGQPDADVQVRVVPISEVRGFDAATRRYGLGGMAVEFPPDAVPSHFLHVEIVRADAGGGRIRVAGITEAIVQHAGVWRLTVGRLRSGR